MKINTQPYKGTRDFYPEDMRLRNWIFETWCSVCISFGYEQYDGPILEPLSLYASKTSDEIVTKQTYAFTDRGNRQVVMRPEMTPTVSRMVAAKRQELSYPLRLFSIPNCFRYERPQKGRLREFWQLNADIFGIENIDADVEIILLADSVMKAFGAKPNQYEIQVNSRASMTQIFDVMKLSEEERKNVLSVIDKKEKVESTEWRNLFKELIGEERSDEFLALLNREEVPHQAQEVIDRLNGLGIPNIKFNRYLARGFDYYTDIVFEVFDKNPDNNRSMFGGGRYDGLVAAFGVEPLPTVGFGMGDATLMNFLETNHLLPKKQTETDLYVVSVGENFLNAQNVAQKLRALGKNVAVDTTERKPEKKIKIALKKGIENIVFVGEKEIESNTFKMKNLTNGEESILDI